MVSPIELRTGGGRILIGPASMLPAFQRSSFPPIAATARLFRDPDCVAQLRGHWRRLAIGGDHHQHLTPGNLRTIVEQAVADYRLALLWVPPPSDETITVTVDAKPKAPPPPAFGRANMPAPSSPAPPIERLTAAEKIDLAIGRSLTLIGKHAAQTEDLRRAAASLTEDEAVRLRVGAYFALVAIPGAGEASMRPLLAQAFKLASVAGVSAALDVSAAAFEATHAKTGAEIDAAATRFADGWSGLGPAMLVWLSMQLQSAQSRGRRKEPDLAETAKSIGRQAADNPMSLVKIIKEEAKSYSSQILDKYGAAAKKAKSEAEDALVGAVQQAVTDVAGKAAGDAAAALLERAREAVDAELAKAEARAAEEVQKAADKAEAVITSELEKAAAKAESIVTEEGLALISRYLSDEEIQTLKRLAGAEMLSRLREGKTGPEDLALYKQQLVAAAKSEGAKAAQAALQDALA
jgi:hypothetical protein